MDFLQSLGPKEREKNYNARSFCKLSVKNVSALKHWFVFYFELHFTFQKKKRLIVCIKKYFDAEKYSLSVWNLKFLQLFR